MTGEQVLKEVKKKSTKPADLRLINSPLCAFLLKSAGLLHVGRSVPPLLEKGKSFITQLSHYKHLMIGRAVSFPQI